LHDRARNHPADHWFIAHVAILWTIGIILVLVGLALMLLGAMGRAVGGRRHYY
jgi:Family of unknown function (DUF6131)